MQTGSTRKGARKRLTALIELSATSNPEMDSGFVKGVGVPLPDLLPKEHVTGAAKTALVCFLAKGRRKQKPPLINC